MRMRMSRKSLEISRSVHCLWRERDVVEGYRSAISLHGHTMHSRESLDFVPRVLRYVPMAQAALEQFEDRHRRLHGKRIPFERAYWRPPLNPRAAYELEFGQIRNQLGLKPLVSLTDHDDLEACAELNTLGLAVPYSIEWTLPYQGTVFHIGVHNLPPAQARPLEAAMAAVTQAPASQRIAELLAALHAIPDVLIVLNHPFSCEELVDRSLHVRLLHQFLESFGGWMHAFELNGLQVAVNSLDTIQLAAERGMPVISGGDRHCCEPNANLNLTQAGSFTEFVHEIRRERRSEVLFMPQYRDPIPARYIEVIWQAVRSYPEFDGRQRWVDRVFYVRDSGETVSIAEISPNGGSALVRSLIALVGFLASPGMRALLCMVMGRVRELEPVTL
jgi:hypothetical protein